jgi:hypothetical protein
MYYKIITGTGENIIVRTDNDGEIDRSVYESMAREIDNEFSVHAIQDWQIDLQAIIDDGKGIAYTPIGTGSAKILIRTLEYHSEQAIIAVKECYGRDGSRVEGDGKPLFSIVAMLPPKNADQIGQDIVKAVNNHDKLVDIVQRAKDMLESDEYDGARIATITAYMNQILEGLNG